MWLVQQSGEEERGSHQHRPVESEGVAKVFTNNNDHVAADRTTTNSSKDGTHTRKYWFADGSSYFDYIISYIIS